MSGRVATRSRQQIVGTVAEVAAAVAAARATGRLESMTAPQRVPGDGRRVYVHIVMRDEPVPTPRRWPVVVAVGTASAVGTGVAGYVAVTWIVAHWAHLLGAGVVALVLMVAVLPRVGVCPGIHCPGCRHQ